MHKGGQVVLSAFFISAESAESRLATAEESETVEQAKRILWQLEKHCGPGNYNYLVGFGDSENLTGMFG